MCNVMCGVWCLLCWCGGVKYGGVVVWWCSGVLCCGMWCVMCGVWCVVGEAA